MGGRQLAIFAVYFLCSAKWLQLVMPAFGRLTAQQQDLEGELRGAHARVLASAEEIAFHGGGAREGERVGAAFQRIVRLKRSIFRRRAYMSFLDTVRARPGVAKHPPRFPQ